MGRYNIENVRKDFEDKGYLLISDTYEKAHDTLFVKNSEGYVGFTTYSRFKYGNSPMIFDKRNPYTINNIRLWMELNESEYTLISTVYEKSDEYLILRCKKHGEFKSTWDNVKQGYGCKKCADEFTGISKRIPLQEVINAFISNDLEPLFETYNNSKELLYAKTNEGYIVGITYGSLVRGSYPFAFSTVNPYTLDNIKLWIKLNGNKYELLSKEFVGAIASLEMYCIEHKKLFKISWNNLSKGEGCYECGIDKRSGENCWNYNPNLTDEERILGRNFMGDESYNDWRKGVYLKNNYTCQLCGKKSKTLNAHHLDGYDWCTERRLDISNGIVVHTTLHVLFHRKYGYGGNKENQFEEFKQRYYNGKFDNELEEELKSYNSIKRLKENRIDINLEEAI